ncbi:metallophosphoesterase family protein [Methanolobus halotolerans]|uniref:Metallophosphoesterase n=1 Tax=Methanolobus halotolerans TaxID=2052935 RepID=A0A4E0QRJ7_9EURY|nr:metallophosphoesterase [Methanolobus halotolerans]TGC09126.1 metallophosphoesterase [Methanolobus halotolerans]
MRIFAIADPHGNYSAIRALLKKSGHVDVVLIAGDITNFGPAEKAHELIGMFDQKVMAVPGNCDPESIIEVINDSSAINLHNRSVTYKDITFMGTGGSNPTPFCTPFEIEECDIEKGLGKIMSEAERSKKRAVLLTHAPPYGVLDVVGGMHVGCKSIARYLGKVDLMVCGHIHEAKGVENKNGTVVVNPGMAARGFAALIDLQATDEKLDVDVCFIEAD